MHPSSLHPPTHTYTPTYLSFPSDTFIYLPSVIHPLSTLHQSTQPSPPSNPSTHLLIQLQFPSIHHLHILPLTTQSAINSNICPYIHTYICTSTHLSKSYLKTQSTHLSSPHPSIHLITCPPIHYYPAIYTSNQTPFPCSSPKTMQKCLGTQHEGLALATALAHGNPVHSGPY